MSLITWMFLHELKKCSQTTLGLPVDGSWSSLFPPNYAFTVKLYLSYDSIFKIKHLIQQICGQLCMYFTYPNGQRASFQKKVVLLNKINYVPLLRHPCLIENWKLIQSYLQIINNGSDCSNGILAHNSKSWDLNNHNVTICHIGWTSAIFLNIFIWTFPL